MDGYILINKPAGPTSHDVCQKIKKLYQTKKVGHAGTLDPQAEGLMIILLGRATRLSEYIITDDKEYVAGIKFGLETDTQDIWGTTIKETLPSFNKSDFFDVITSMVGEIEQKPPMYAALKHKGKPLYEYARKGITIDRKERTITIYEIDVMQDDIPQQAQLRVSCSKGTYIRTLCHDIGQKLSCGAVMNSLQRIKIGSFDLKNATSLQMLESLSMDERELLVCPMDQLMQHLKSVQVNPESERIAQNGNALLDRNIIAADEDILVDELVRIYVENRFVAIGIKQEDGSIQPKKVLTAAEF